MPIKAPAAALLLLAPLLAIGGGQQPAPSPYKLQLSQQSKYKLLNASFALNETAPTPAALSKKPYAKEIDAAARASRLDPVLVHALIHVESRHRKDAVSNRGALGLMQVMPATALRFGVDKPTQVSANLKAGTRYLRMLLDLYDQRLDLALSAYNAGEGAVARYGGIPPYAETRRYVPAVLNTYSTWRGGNIDLRRLDTVTLETDNLAQPSLIR
jgi:soluble lytic murein transglycosylase-like protein